MPLKFRSKLTAGLLVVPLAAALVASGAVAARAASPGPANAHRLHRAHVVPRWHQHPGLYNLYNSVPSPWNLEDWPANQPYPCSTLPSFCDPDLSNGG